MQEPSKKWYNIIEGGEILPPKILGDYMTRIRRFKGDPKTGDIVRIKTWTKRSDGHKGKRTQDGDVGVVLGQWPNQKFEVLFEDGLRLGIHQQDLDVVKK